MTVTLALINPKNELNYGGILRAAACYDIDMLVIQGKRFKKQSADTTKAWRSIPTLLADDVFDHIPVGAVPVAVEFIQTATSLPAFQHPKNAFYILGPEDGSIPAHIVARCKHVVYVPTKHCMNLAATANVLLYDRLAKQQKE